jgi:uncharacterized protein YjbI with pentapeptide repeats
MLASFLIAVMAPQTLAVDVNIPAQSCLANAGSVDGSKTNFPTAIDGTKLRKVGDFKKLRGKQKDDRLVVIEGGDFKGWKLRNIKLKNICFRGSDFTKSDWSNAKTSGLGFINSRLDGANLINAAMPFVLLRTTHMQGTDARAGHFAYGQMDGGWDASIAGLKLDSADMRGFRIQCGTTAMDGCPFNRQGLSARKTDFRKANLYGFTAWGADFTDALIDDATIGIDQIGQVRGAMATTNVNLRGGAQIRSIDVTSLGLLRSGLAEAERLAENCLNSPAKPSGSAIMICSDGSQLAKLASDVMAITNGSGSKSATGRSRERFDRSVTECMKLGDPDLKPCLESSFYARRNDLVTNTPAPSWLGKSRYLLFVDSTLPLPQNISEGIWLKLAPVLAGGSDSMLLIKDTGRGRFDVRGLAMTNGEGQCIIETDAAVFSGNVLLETNGRKSRPSGAILRFAANKAEVHPDLIALTAKNAGKLSSCNETLNPGMMTRIPVSESDFALLWQSLDTDVGK